jgi:hypothetical protein
MMNLPARITSASTFMLIIVAATGPTLAQEKGDRSVDQYTCKDIMRESGPSRDVSIAFVHGYLLGKANATTFNVEKLHQQTDAFINRCLDNPNEKALEAMMKLRE